MNLVEMMAYNDSQKGYGAPSGNAGIMDMFINQIKAKQDADRKQKNIETQMTDAKKMMETMAGMPDQTSAGKASSIVDGSSTSSSRGIIKSNNVIPTREFSFDENGTPSIKIGFKTASPTEQKSMMEVQQMELDRAKAEDLRQHSLGYLEGSVPEGIMAEVIVRNGGTDKDLASLRMMKESKFSKGGVIPSVQNVPEGYRMSGYAPDALGTMQPKGIEPIPATEIKAQRDMASQDKTDALKSENAIKSAENTIKSIDHLTKNINFFGPIEGAMPAGLNAGKREWRKNYDYLQSNNILNVLREMKAQSSTGATGFGALNERELGIIENAAMKLDKQMDEPTAKKYLDEMKGAFQTIIDREKNGYKGEVSADNSVPSVGGTFNGEKVISVKRIK